MRLECLTVWWTWLMASELLKSRIHDIPISIECYIPNRKSFHLFFIHIDVSCFRYGFADVLFVVDCVSLVLKVSKKVLGFD